jgi:hypothetical protein
MAAFEYFLVNNCGRSVELTTNFLICETNIRIPPEIPQYYGSAVLKNRSDEVTPLSLSTVICSM